MRGLLSLETNERKNLSLWIMFGGAVVFTLYATAGLVLVSDVPKYVYWLAVIAHIQIFSLLAGFIAQLVKRRVHAGKDGVEITDYTNEEIDTRIGVEIEAGKKRMDITVDKKIQDGKDEECK